MPPRDARDQREPDRASEVSLRILRYLEQNPNAADTLDGILEWWLPKQSIYEQEKIVQQALDGLIEQELIITKRSTDMRKHYRLNTERLREIRQMIKSAREKSDK
jgi:hypothetical protein